MSDRLYIHPIYDHWKLFTYFSHIYYMLLCSEKEPHCTLYHQIAFLLGIRISSFGFHWSHILYCFVFEEKLIWKKSAGWKVICVVQYVCFVPIKTAVISPFPCIILAWIMILLMFMIAEMFIGLFFMILSDARKYMKSKHYMNSLMVMYFSFFVSIGTPSFLSPQDIISLLKLKSKNTPHKKNAWTQAVHE